MTKYTFTRKYAARTVGGMEYVYIPDQIVDSQRDFDGCSFTVLRRDGTKARATLRGDLYGLWTTGTGDPVVSIC
ncbi:MAG: hypothetical protein RL535_1513 [Pseudomonadota bacterium]|jgi:hypothetical protein